MKELDNHPTEIPVLLETESERFNFETEEVIDALTDYLRKTHRLRPLGLPTWAEE